MVVVGLGALCMMLEEALVAKRVIPTRDTSLITESHLAVAAENSPRGSLPRHGLIPRPVVVPLAPLILLNDPIFLPLNVSPTKNERLPFLTFTRSNISVVPSLCLLVPLLDLGPFH